MPDGTATTRKSKLLGTKAELIKPSKPTILIYGASGVRKTTFAIDWPDVYFIDVEGGAKRPQYRKKLIASNASYIGPQDGAASFDVVLDQVKTLATEEHDRKTLVIDSITKLFANEVANEARKLSDAGKKNEFAADRKPAVNYMRQLVSWLTRMDMNVILIAGEIAEWKATQTTGRDQGYGEREQVGMTFDCWPRLEYELDMAIQVILLGDTAYGKIRKSRVQEFPKASTFEFTYDKFTEIYGRDIVEGASSRVDVATPEQIGEINRLLNIVKLEEGTVDKWLAAANVSAWDEMASARADKAIDYLKKRIEA